MNINIKISNNYNLYSKLHQRRIDDKIQLTYFYAFSKFSFG